MNRLFRLMAPAFWNQGDRAWYGSLGVSSLVHLGAILLLSALWLTPRPATTVEVVETLWAPAGELPVVTRIEAIETSHAVPTATAGAAGGRWAGPHSPSAPSASSAVQVAASAGSTATAIDFFRPFPEAAHLQERVVEGLPGFRPGGSGKSMGVNYGDVGGRGDGGGFFGMKTPGKSIVYVVDRSKSMNHPHDSEARTRFRRVKYELLKSIGLMDESFRFFVIFFNDEAHPMPATGLQVASPLARERYLRWVATMDALGTTDPRTSLEMALRLRPDIVYFLTDGSFDRGVGRQLLELRQQGTVIHTFAFGNPEGETVLKAIADANGGTYRFIP